MLILAECARAILSGAAVLLNAAKVITHLYSGSLAHCITWPSAMQRVMDFAAVFALDLFSEARIPCFSKTFARQAFAGLWFALNALLFTAMGPISHSFSFLCNFSGRTTSRA